MKKSNILAISIVIFILIFYSCDKVTDGKMNIEIVTSPSILVTSNSHYVSNRAPLVPSALIKLPLGAIQPQNWLKECMERQAEGLMGNLGEISAWLQKENNAWLSNDGKGAWGWEEVPYWLKGYLNSAYILGDKTMINESQIWIDAAINSQRSDGNFGPVIISEKDGSQDFWSNMIMLYCLQSYYEYTQDERIIDLMSKYFKFQLSLPDENLLSKTQYWQHIRGGDNLHSVLWLYNRTGEKWLLDLAKKLHRVTAPWSKRDNTLEEIRNWKEVREGMVWPDWYGKLIDWHNVNVAQCFREPAQYYLVSGDKQDLQATYDNFDIIREYFGQVPGGMFGADENARPGYDDPRQGIETCGIVEQMNSDEHMIRITGDIFWADHAEKVAFNTLPAAFTPDFKSLRYITSPNMVLNDNKNHRPGIMNDGPFLMMNPFSSRCCQHNHGQGWPYLSENLWMATPDNGLAAVIYAANNVKAKVGDGTEVSIITKSNYPFEEDVTFTVKCKKEDVFPLYFRIPGWCKSASIVVNDKKVQILPEAGKYIKLEKYWQNNDKITLSLPKELNVRKWENNHNSVSVNYGPLTFSLKIGEAYVKKESDKTAIGDSKWQKGVDKEKWPSFEIHPNTAWNYGLVLDASNPESSFELELKPWPKDNFPFTNASVPYVLKAKGKKIPAWKLDQYGLAGELQDSPVISDEPMEILELVPMGASRLRVSSIPVIGEDGKVWK
ncbi:hypothetical protein FF125_02820 [Aureibaculum algae]|uniref:Transcriptional initiation protein Tat n=1 Tax=Aureibaculum algae TaxID=2584122 RepID=A0A5B7TR35_9FLAO|nr:beta-L-arabinofuranosidase domain-containing protein [Aureibaculum algae]QCX37417.1 hypothetical protein FF125_02820 [Aureibaculum algae]